MFMAVAWAEKCAVVHCFPFPLSSFPDRGGSWQRGSFRFNILPLPFFSLLCFCLSQHYKPPSAAEQITHAHCIVFFYCSEVTSRIWIRPFQSARMMLFLAIEPQSSVGNLAVGSVVRRWKANQAFRPARPVRSMGGGLKSRAHAFLGCERRLGRRLGQCNDVR